MLRRLMHRKLMRRETKTHEMQAQWEKANEGDAAAALEIVKHLAPAAFAWREYAHNSAAFSADEQLPEHVINTRYHMRAFCSDITRWIEPLTEGEVQGEKNGYVTFTCLRETFSNAAASVSTLFADSAAPRSYATNAACTLLLTAALGKKSSGSFTPENRSLQSKTSSPNTVTLMSNTHVEIPESVLNVAARAFSAFHSVSIAQTEESTCTRISVSPRGEEQLPEIEKETLRAEVWQILRKHAFRMLVIYRVFEAMREHEPQVCLAPTRSQLHLFGLDWEELGELVTQFTGMKQHFDASTTAILSL